MSRSRYDERFFESTRGRIVKSLRYSSKTVNDLAAETGLTDNAVRAHLLSLERDHLVEAGGTIKGFRKPHAVFRLTAEARHIFPKAYDALLNRLLDVLKLRTPKAALDDVLQEVGISIAESQSATTNFDEAVGSALRTLEELGGAAVTECNSGGTTIRSESCPFADAVVEHPEICKVAQSMIQEIVGRPVHEQCDRTALPKCRFEIADPVPNAG